MNTDNESNNKIVSVQLIGPNSIIRSEENISRIVESKISRYLKQKKQKTSLKYHAWNENTALDTAVIDRLHAVK